MTAQNAIYSTLTDHLFYWFYIGTNPLTVGFCDRHCRPLWPQGAPCFLLLYFQPRGSEWFWGNAEGDFCRKYHQSLSLLAIPQIRPNSPSTPPIGITTLPPAENRTQGHTAGARVPDVCLNGKCHLSVVREFFCLVGIYFQGNREINISGTNNVLYD